MVCVLAVGALWCCAAFRPSTFVTLLFAAAPWMGLFVQWGFQMDAYKIGLLVLPLLLLSCSSQKIKLRVSKIPLPLMALLAYSVILTAWQMWSSEMMFFREMLTASAAPFSQTLMASEALFILRILSFLAVASICVTPQLRNRCAAVYVGSVLALALFGIAQEIVYLLSGSFLTSIMRDGLFGSFRETAGTVDVAGVSLMRIYSLAREPKDLALFCLPAIALLIAQSSTSTRRGQRRLVTLKLFAIMLAGLLTCSSAFLILLPLVIVATLVLRLKIRGARSQLNQLRWVWALVVLIPLLAGASQTRVIERFGSWIDLLQVSRERPAVAFMADNTPRWFAGFGIGTQSFYLPSYMPAQHSADVNRLGGLAGVESFYLALLLDFGLIGAFCMLAAVVTLLKRGGNHATFPYRAAFVATLLAGVPLEVDLRSGILWLFAGLLWGAITDRSNLANGVLAASRPAGPLHQGARHAVIQADMTLVRQRHV